MLTLQDSVRASIPAVCRLRRADSSATAGTGVLIADGLLLTSTTVFGSRVANAAADFVAVFFEGTKKRPIEACLQPTRFFFAAEYPAYMDYCLVACEAHPVANITPVQLPLVRRQWGAVEEGDTVLIVQHPIGGCPRAPARAAALPHVVARPHDAACEERAGDGPLQLVCFEEVLRRRHELLHLKANGNIRTAGCPVFADSGQLVGLQSQTQTDGEGVVNCVLTITSIVQHLFANKQLSHLSANVAAADVWDTWHVHGDVARLLAIPCNFSDACVTEEATRRLCALANDTAHVDSVVANGGVSVLVGGLQRLQDDAKCVYQCLRALWHVGTQNENALSMIVAEQGMPSVCAVVDHYRDDAEVAQLAVLLLHNVVSCTDTTDEQARQLTRTVYAAMQRFLTSHILQKFGAALLTHVVVQHASLAHELAQQGVVAHTCRLLADYHAQVLVMEAVLRLLAELVQHREVVTATQASSARPCPALRCVDLVISVMLEHANNDTVLLHGNRTLWGLGDNAHCRAVLLQNPHYVNAFQLSLPVLLTRSVVT